MSRPWLVVVGSSTGAPPVLHTILSGLEPPLPCPVVIAHHILSGFEAGLADYLSQSGHPVTVAERAQRLVPGQVYLAPAVQNLVLCAQRVVPRPPGPERFIPSADVLFRSAASLLGTHQVLAVLLTGMGRDGAQGLLEIRQAGGITVTQSAESCAVDGMPAAARRLGASHHALPPAEIAALIEATVRARPPLSSRERLLQIIGA